ncbi:MAG: ORF6N domain-containing protein [Opitutaceae bacterium]|nr:ORF6N domain-containing protein [Opitutaceae bacterium]
MRTPKKTQSLTTQERTIETRIVTIRGIRVLLDLDLAEIYGVSTKALNQAIKRNADKFPNDFMFQLAPQEKAEVVTNCDHLRRLKYSPVLPYAFTEHGAIMAANVLNSPAAVRLSVYVVRAFVQMRELLGGTRELALQLAALDRRLTGRLDRHEVAIIEVLHRIMTLIDPPPPPPEPPRRRIGFVARRA